jgi:hypothetical protein
LAFERIEVSVSFLLYFAVVLEWKTTLVNLSISIGLESGELHVFDRVPLEATPIIIK